MTTITHITLMTCALSVGQVGDRAGWLLVPRFEQGQELFYSGTCVEESLAPGARFQKKYRLHNRLLVLKADRQGWEVAVLTSLEAADEGGRNRPDDARPAASSARLEVVRVDPQGYLTPAPGRGVAVPLDGPATVEIGCVVAAPKIKVGPRHFWEVAEPDRPPLKWRIAGTEVVSSTGCVKLEGVQQSDDWEAKRADSTAWRRTDRVWIAPQNGIVYKVEREVETREPAREHPTHRHTVRYELGSQLTYPGQMFEDRRQEIAAADRWAGEAARYLQAPTRFRTEMEVLERQIEAYLRHRPPTPYRPAILQTRHRLEAVRSGEVVAQPLEPVHAPAPGGEGKAPPDFLASDLVTGKSVRLRGLAGRPVLLIFYNPRTENGRRVLDFGCSVREKYGAKVAVLAMAVTADADFARRQHAELELPFPVLDGNGLTRTFGVDATPRAVVLDGDGQVLGGHTGWGLHTPDEVLRDIDRGLAGGPAE